MGLVHISNFAVRLHDRQTNGDCQITMLSFATRRREEELGTWIPKPVHSQVFSQESNIAVQVTTQDRPMLHGALHGVLPDSAKRLFSGLVAQRVVFRGSKVSVVDEQRPRPELETRELHVAPPA